MSKVVIERARRDEAGQLALLHQKEIGSGYLSKLGYPFLRSLYSTFSDLDYVDCLVAREDATVVGFVCGCENTARLYRDFMVQNFFSVAPRLLVKLIRPSILLGLIRHVGRALRPSSNDDLPEAELLSLAVKEAYRRRGLARALVTDLGRRFSQKQIYQFKVVAGSKLTAANSFYNKMGFDPVGQVKVHSNEVSNIYVADLKESKNSAPAES